MAKKEGTTSLTSSGLVITTLTGYLPKESDSNVKGNTSKIGVIQMTLWYPNKRMANKYTCSDGTKITQRQIDYNRSQAYFERYKGSYALCDNCGRKATESSHIISQARCKEIHKTELIWNNVNFVPSCRECHKKWEGNDKTIAKYDQYMAVVELYDEEGYLKRKHL